MCFNRIELIGSKEEIDDLLNMYSNYYPAMHTGIIREYKNIDDEICNYNRLDNLYILPNGEEVEELPEGYIPKYHDAYRDFPDFNKIIPEPEKHYKAFLEDEDFFHFDDMPYVKWRLKNWGVYQIAFGFEMESETVFYFESDFRVPDLIKIISVAHPSVTIIP